MPSGSVHTATSVILSVPIGLSVGNMAGDVAGLGAALGCLAGVFVNPDLDVNGLTSSEWKLIKFSIVLGMLWTLAWLPYAFILKHRSFLSHSIILSTAIRIGYMWLVLLAGAWLFGRVLGVRISINVPPMPMSVQSFLWGAFGGLCASDAAHIIMDRLIRTRRK